MSLRPASLPWPRRVRAELEATDWERHPIVDVVTFAPATSRGLEGDRQRIEVYRYREPPALEVYENPERSYVVERVTRPLYERGRRSGSSAGTD